MLLKKLLLLTIDFGVTGLSQIKTTFYEKSSHLDPSYFKNECRFDLTNYYNIKQMFLIKKNSIPLVYDQL